MTGEIRIKKGDFRGDLVFFRGLDLVWGRFPKRKAFFRPSHKETLLHLKEYSKVKYLQKDGANISRTEDPIKPVN